MKHLLNNLSEEEKNNIRQKHKGGLKVTTENFKRLVDTKSGLVKPLVNEQSETSGTTETPEIVTNVATEGIKNVTDQMIQSPPFKGYYSGYVIQGEFNNTNYSWNLRGVEGMSGIRGMIEGVITCERNSTLSTEKYGIEFPDLLENGVWVGFYSETYSQGQFICY